ncbi:MAG TPA: hypothetical protein VGG32_07100 [Thermoplasmata archaeon]
MSSRMSQRSVYLVTAAIVASMVGGFALAQMSIGGTNTSYQGSQTTTVQAVPGLTWLSTNLTAIPSALLFSANSCRTLGTPCDVASTGYTLCVGGLTGSTLCNAGDFVEQVNLSISNSVDFPASTFGATPTSAVTLTVYVTGTPVGFSPGVFVGFTCYFQESVLPGSPEVLTLDFDIGTTTAGPGGVTAVSVIATTATT